ncbi:uncharacterized protein TNCV_2166611 [Trichonephila clavipes]|nr:uncharacterized protein TNCV_2166611 [Trichonephila clavipes]
MEIVCGTIATPTPSCIVERVPVGSTSACRTILRSSLFVVFLVAPDPVSRAWVPSRVHCSQQFLTALSERSTWPATRRVDQPEVFIPMIRPLSNSLNCEKCLLDRLPGMFRLPKSSYNRREVLEIAAIGLYARTTRTRHGLKDMFENTRRISRIVTAAMDIRSTTSISELMGVSFMVALKDPCSTRGQLTTACSTRRVFYRISAPSAAPPVLTSKNEKRFISPSSKGLLPTEVSHIIAREPDDKANSYEHVKDLLLKRFKLTPEKFRQLFVTHQKAPERTWIDFYYELNTYFNGWIDGLKIDTFNKLSDLIITDQLKRKTPFEFKEYYLDECANMNSPCSISKKTRRIRRL